MPRSSQSCEETAKSTTVSVRDTERRGSGDQAQKGCGLRTLEGVCALRAGWGEGLENSSETQPETESSL